MEEDEDNHNPDEEKKEKYEIDLFEKEENINSKCE